MIPFATEHRGWSSTFLTVSSQEVTLRSLFPLYLVEAFTVLNWRIGAEAAALKLSLFSAHHLVREQAVWQELLSF